MKLLIDIIGWIGSVEVILAYGLNSYQKLKSDSLTFQILNVTGAAFLIINTVYYGAFPSAFINVVWVLIAIPAIFKIIRKKQSAL
ncbi:MAG TPA: hypothetical protein PKJ63_10400 [Cyclobacteriaceae bacterium]|nr:hypothetical protein [Cyclobacteriaceae bacterium]HRW99272.1 hypothetical protein [Cyclobacteriaceae bacterium]